MARANKKTSENKNTEKRRAAKKDRIPKHIKVDEGLLTASRKYFVGFDTGVIITVIALCVFGILMVYSASYYTTTSISDNPYYYLIRQLIWAGSGFVILVAAANFDYHKYYRYANILIVISIALLLMVLAFGINVNGATRWIGFGAFRITPSEFSKLFVIIWTSVFLARDPNNIHDKRGVLILFGVMLTHAGLIIKQPNLSTAMVIVFIMMAIMFVAGLHTAWIAAGFGAAAAGTFIILKYMKDSHWYSRLTNWIDPFADAQGEGYQVSQSIIALGNGGLKGLGFSKGVSKNLYLPEPQNDFILAVIGEEFGYIGFLALMAVYFILIFRLIVIALQARDKLGFYLATGVSAIMGLQVIINVAVVTSSMPATGITLPFISYGGTSIWVFMAAIGIALNVGKQSDRRKVKAKR